MGQGNCKNRIITVPSNPPCFPYFNDEKHMLEVCKKASHSLTVFRETLSLVSGLVLDASQLTTLTLCLSATAVLIQFAIHRLSQDKDKPPSSSANGEEGLDNPEGALTLEDILLEMKIDKCIVKSAVSSLKAKLTAISNRYARLILQEELSMEERRLEVVPALALCEEIVELFRDPENVFAKNPIVSTPFIVTFGGVYVAVAELTLVILPSYLSFLVKQMKLLGRVLIFYKESCIRERQAGLLMPKRSSEMKMPDTLYDGFSQPKDGEEMEEFYHMHDPFMKANNNNSLALPNSDSTKGDHDDDDEYLQFATREEAAAAYKLKLEEKYNMFFSGVLKNVADFSGFSPEDREGPSGTTEIIEYFETEAFT